MKVLIDVFDFLIPVATFFIGCGVTFDSDFLYDAFLAIGMILFGAILSFDFFVMKRKVAQKMSAESNSSCPHQ